MKIGFIGTGNMGGALAKAVRRSLPQAQILLSDRALSKAELLAREIDATVTDSKSAARTCDYLFLGVKPQMLAGLAGEIGEIIAGRTDCTLISMAAGVTIGRIAELFGNPTPVIRIMPNTPVAVGEGMILWCTNAGVSEQAKTDFCSMLAAGGELCALEEGLIDAGCALSGCGPAFVCLFLEALADGAVECGLPRESAKRLAMQTLLGTATLMKQTGSHPAEMKDAVCSPSGSTIAGVHALESGAFRADVMNAVTAAFARTRELGK